MDLSRWLKMPGILVQHLSYTCARLFVKVEPWSGDICKHVDLQGILSNICMMRLKKLLKHTRLLALQNSI